jgi:hypothetical protein
MVYPYSDPSSSTKKCINQFINIIAMSSLVLRKVRRAGTSPTIVSIPPDFGLKPDQYVVIRKEDSKIVIEPLEVS